jgi:hypothetical protein
LTRSHRRRTDDPSQAGTPRRCSSAHASDRAS